MAADRGLDLGSIEGSGAGGKVVKADVLAAADGGRAGAGAAAPGAEPRRAPDRLKRCAVPRRCWRKAMNESRGIPTATSFRTVPVDTLDAKRKALNGVLKDRGMKVSFTHLVAWAIVKATEELPVMARTFEIRDGKPLVVEPATINLGIAVDVERKGSRSLMVPASRAPTRSTSRASTATTRS